MLGTLLSCDRLYKVIYALHENGSVFLTKDGRGEMNFLPNVCTEMLLIKCSSSDIDRNK